MARPSHVYNIPRLCESMTHDRRALSRAREERREAVRHYIGKHWNEQGSPFAVPLNVLAQFIRIVSRNLIAKDPRASFSTFDRKLKPVAEAMQWSANQEIERMHLGDTEQRVVIDALFNIGIIKVALSTPQDAAMAAWTTTAGRPFAERVSLDDFGFDRYAADFREATCIFHRYRAPLDTIRDDKRFHKDRKDMKGAPMARYNAEGDERTRNMGRGWHGDDCEYEDFVDLWEVYHPRHRLVTTLIDKDGTPAPCSDGEPLLAQDWIGPDNGPYHFLGLGIVPDNAMPLSPVMLIIDLATTINHLYLKLIDQAESQKDLLLAMLGTEAKVVTDAKDGAVLNISRPDGFHPVSLGGPNPLNAQFAGGLQQLFNEQGGNLKTMGGLGIEAKTARQEDLLNQNSSAGVADMQDSVVRHLASVIGALSWYWYHDPFKTIESNYQIPGMPSLSLNRSVFPAGYRGEGLKRDGDFKNLTIKCDPYSLRHKSPQQRVAELDEAMMKVILPMMPFLQQMGKAPDIDFYLRKRAELLDSPDLQELMQVIEPVMESSSPEGPTKPGQTERTYTRRSMSQNGDQTQGQAKLNRDNAMSEMAAAGSQNGQYQT